MMPTTKRPGSELERVEQEVMPEGNTLTTQACIWGIEKYFDQKQCYKHFVKYFGQQDLTHLCKYKNKPFYLVRFMKPINIEAFNSENAKNKRVKIKPIQ